MPITGFDVWLQPKTVPAGTDFPGNVQGLVDLIAGYLQIAGIDNFNGINSGPNEPSEGDRDKVWYRTDEAGKLLGFYFWNGSDWAIVPTVPETGGSDARPANPEDGQQFFDSEIHVMLVYERGAWRTLAGSPGDVKEVKCETIEEALLRNPGWAQDTNSIGMVIGGADQNATDAESEENDHVYYSVHGEEYHEINQQQIPRHRHFLFRNGDVSENEGVGNSPTNSAVQTKADYNGRRDYSLAGTDTGSDGAYPDVGYSSWVGGGDDGVTEPLGLRQPTIYYWRLVKQ
jgi:hypothetical protein